MRTGRELRLLRSGGHRAQLRKRARKTPAQVRIGDQEQVVRVVASQRHLLTDAGVQFVETGDDVGQIQPRPPVHRLLMEQVVPE